MSSSVQFGRAQQGIVQRWSFFIAFAMWCFTLWLFHWPTNPLGGGLVLAAFSYWSGRSLNRGARVERGVVVFRTGSKQERVPASEITSIHIEKTPGLLTRSVYVRIDRGRFESFDVLRAKAPDTPEGRQRLQAKVDEASVLLHSSEDGQ